MTSYIPFPAIGPNIFAFEVFGFTLALRWYAMAYIVGIVIGWRIAVRAVRNATLWGKGGPAMSAEQVEELLTWVVFGVILGGRLGYVMFYQPAYYLQNPVEIPMLWNGGMAFHGGLLGVVVAVWMFCARHQLNVWKAADMLAVATPMGLMLGRLANFINAELWGRPTLSPIGVAFPGLPAQDCDIALQHANGICARHPSQLYEAALEGLLLGTLLLYLVWRRGWLKVPGQIWGLFFAGYGAARFIVEFFRQADAQFIAEGNPMGYVLQFGAGGVSMGQLLSLPMVVFGVGLIIYVRRHAARAG